MKFVIHEDKIEMIAETPHDQEVIKLLIYAPTKMRDGSDWDERNTKMNFIFKTDDELWGT